MAPRFALIVPTRRAAVVLALAAPVALLVAAVAPGAWIAAPALGGMIFLLVLADALAAGGLREFRVLAPGDVEVGASEHFTAQASFSGGQRARVDSMIACDPRLAPGGRYAIALAGAGREAAGSAGFQPSRRGTGRIGQAWLRWSGPLGLGARQRVVDVDIEVRVWPNIGDVRSPALQTFLRDAQFGLIARRIRGEGTQFEALAEYQPGMDRRRIDWKASARHVHLYAKENETERNNPIVFAFDCGQTMCEPIAGMPRIDRAVSAALATAYVALKGGDRVSLFGFASRPEVMTPFITSASEFHRLQRAAATLDYRAEEPNFTLALATLAGRLQRRSLIVVFSDFTDPTSAELMIESIGRLVSRHLVLFVTLADEELEELSGARPADLRTLSMAVSADLLLRQRALVTRRLKQLGVDVIEAPWRQVGTRLIDAYLAIKRSGAIG
ncbi:DUF58 domain-containing protein [Novosphingobium album (ex Liu et al. 2023)]|uniref:DUF58 domain-containing protein n=1 Tax=Novosphingobium album (ex Liu et al. 2023) TaxID=3031130 RepID=A0ABT5WM09_9SPHN|nr:DUF58 domain-containing protein [Novosphingobium album (ex Liu et al. 2023)]MDE8651081.1 DUF58 domain-containing protein [Novosphingobium album (ex Liu et al. 2023)]